MSGKQQQEGRATEDSEMKVWTVDGRTWRFILIFMRLPKRDDKNSEGARSSNTFCEFHQCRCSLYNITKGNG